LVIKVLHIGGADVINDVQEQLALPQDERGKHINGVIKRLPEACS